MSKLISLTKGQFAIVDDEDYDILNQWKWHACWNRTTQSYTARRRRHKEEEGGSVHVLMHRQILDTPEDSQVDHGNHNTLDNRRSNIHNATGSENCHNRRNIRGCVWHKRKKKWMAATKIHGKSIFLGYYDTVVEAQNAYWVFKSANVRPLFVYRPGSGASKMAKIGPPLSAESTSGPVSGKSPSQSLF
jgi:hypothetical protein